MSATADLPDEDCRSPLGSWSAVWSPDVPVCIGAAGARLGAELDRMGWDRVVVFASASSVRSGLVARVEETALAGRRVLARHAGVRSHAPVADIDRIAAELADTRPQALIAIGGGSTSDTAKGVALLLPTGGRLYDHTDAGSTPRRGDEPRARGSAMSCVSTCRRGTASRRR